MSVGMAVIGSGQMGRTYAGTIRDHTTGARLVSIAGGSRSAAVAEEFGTDFEPSVAAALARPDVDAVILATPHSQHLPNTLQAAAAGKHIYVEKPMARTVAECDAMIQACRDAGVLLAVNKVLRFRVAALAARAAVEDGTIGELRMMLARHVHSSFLVADKAWVYDPAEGSRWLDWGSHCCDLFRWYSDSEPVSAHANYANYSKVPPAGQTASVEYRFASGVIAHALMSYEFPAPGLVPTDQILLVGSKAMVDVDIWGRVRLGKGRRWQVIAEQAPIDYMVGYMHPNRLLAFASQVQDFVDAITSGRQPVIGGADGRAAVEMVQAADRSAATGEAVALPLGSAASNLT